LKTLFPLLAALALFVMLSPAHADEFYLEGRYGVEVTDFDNIEDGQQLKAAFGYDFEPIRIEAEYAWGNHADSELAGMAYYDIVLDSKFTPFIGAGAGVMVEDIFDFEFGGAFWKVGAGVAYGISDSVDLTAALTYRREFDDSDNDRTEVYIGTRVSF